jgi:hypothetical protein
VAGGLAALVALAPDVGEAAESDGVGTGLIESLGDGDGDGDGDTGGLTLTVGLGLGFGLQLGDGCEDGAGEPDEAAGVPLPGDGEVTGDELGPLVRAPLPGLLPPGCRFALAAEPILLDWPAWAKLWVRCCVRASAPDPTTSTNAAAAASGRSQPYGAGAPPAVTGRSQRSAAAGKERRRSVTEPDGSASVASQAAVAGRGAWIRALIRSRPPPSGSTDSAAARRAARKRSS